MNGSQVKEQLQQLLKQHGVAATRLATCADELLVALSPASVGSILKSPKPWTDLKARANLHEPPIRIVLAAELLEVRQQETAAGPVGTDHWKIQKHHQEVDVLKLRSQQITQC